MRMFGTAGRGRHAIALSALLCAAVLVAGSEDASAWAWSSKVTVAGSVSTCGPSNTNGWGWFQADNGESGWLTWSRKSTFTFNLNRVPGWGASTLVTIRWGAGGCETARHRVISRPAYGTLVGLGFLG